MRLEHLLSGAIGFYPVDTTRYVKSFIVYIKPVVQYISVWDGKDSNFQKKSLSLQNEKSFFGTPARLEHSPIAQLVRALH